MASYPQATNRLEAQATNLPCENWSATSGGYVYHDDAAAHGGVRRITYTSSKLVIKLRGQHFTPVAGPVGYMEVWFRVGSTRYLGRFHNFRRNDATVMISRRPSSSAAEGEAAFWDVLLGTDISVQRQNEAIAALTKAAKHASKDGRSRFLLGMLHLYRFGQDTTSYDEVSAFGLEEVAASHAAFETALPRLWDGVNGDSRVPGFAAVAKFTQGLVTGDDALRDEGLQDLAEAIAINQFFNVFDYIPVIQAFPPGDPLFQTAFDEVADYLGDPDTLNCVQAQPELCANEGLAPHNAEGALLLFGDVYAKAGDLPTAQAWYALANVIVLVGGVPWPFQAVLDDRLANAADRVALYQDADPTNDPPVVGAAQEACAICHYK